MEMVGGGGESKEWSPDQNFLTSRVLEDVSFLLRLLTLETYEYYLKIEKNFIEMNLRTPRYCIFIFYKSSLAAKVI